MPHPTLAAEIAPRLALARSAGVEAGDLTLEYFQREGLGFERKGDQSPVTVADRAAEELLRRRIAAAFPRDAILGEEYGEVAGTSGFRWILDPIDGTKSFISGVPLYGTMVGVEHEGRSLVGLVYIPGLREGVFAALKHGTWHFATNAQAAVSPPRRVHVSQRPKLADGLFVTSQVDTFAKRGAMAVFDALQGAAYITRTWGDCYGYLLVATGRAEAMVDPMLNIWDAAAIQPIIEGAGGTFTDWRGEATIHAGEAIATNGLVLAEVLAATSKAPRLPA